MGEKLTIKPLEEVRLIPVPSYEQPKRVWRKPEVRTLTLAFTGEGSGTPVLNREEEASHPSKAGYMPDS